MPELPEVETVRRALLATVRGRMIQSVRLSGERLRAPVPPTLPRRVKGRSIRDVRRHGKFLLVDLDGGITLISHLGMSGRWLFHERPPKAVPDHVHARFAFRDGSVLWFQDPRRFGLLRLATTDRVRSDPSLARLGADPVAEPPTADGLLRIARGLRVNVKTFLMDQRRVAGIGNIYASEILFRAGVDPRRRAGALRVPEWDAVARETSAVLGEAIARFGTTFSMYRTLWNEPGTYGERLFVYDRADEPCRRCGHLIRRLVQAQRSTYYCPRCQSRPASTASRAGSARSRAPRS